MKQTDTTSSECVIQLSSMNGGTACHPSQHSGDGDRMTLGQPRISTDPVSTWNKTARVIDISEETTILSKETELRGIQSFCEQKHKISFYEQKYGKKAVSSQ